MLTQDKGGIPRHVNSATAIATVERWAWNNDDTGGPARYLWFKNTGTGPLTLSFTLADATALRGITLAAAAIWEGPTEIDSFYTRSAAAQAFEAVAFIRRG